MSLQVHPLQHEHQSEVPLKQQQLVPGWTEGSKQTMVDQEEQAPSIQQIPSSRAVFATGNTQNSGSPEGAVAFGARLSSLADLSANRLSDMKLAELAQLSNLSSASSNRSSQINNNNNGVNISPSHRAANQQQSAQLSAAGRTLPNLSSLSAFGAGAFMMSDGANSPSAASSSSAFSTGNHGSPTESRRSTGLGILGNLARFSNLSQASDAFGTSSFGNLSGLQGAGPDIGRFTNLLPENLQRNSLLNAPSFNRFSFLNSHQFLGIQNNQPHQQLQSPVVEQPHGQQQFSPNQHRREHVLQERGTAHNNESSQHRSRESSHFNKSVKDGSGFVRNENSSGDSGNGSPRFIVGLNSLDLFMSFVKETPDPMDPSRTIVDASPILSKECFEAWIGTRRSSLKKPEESFRRALTAHVTGADRRRPFPPRVEEKLLVQLRKQKTWACFEGRFSTTEGRLIKIGEQGFRTLGYHERKRSESDESQGFPGGLNQKKRKHDFEDVFPAKRQDVYVDK